MTAHAAPPTGPLQVLGMAALVLLPVMGIFGGIEFRAQLLTVLRKIDAAGRAVRRHRFPGHAVAASMLRPGRPNRLETGTGGGGPASMAVTAGPPAPRHASTERIHAGGRYYGTLPRRDALPLTEQPIIVNRAGRPWDTAANPVLAVAYPCCEHCTDGSPCNPRDSHKIPCTDGCNEPAPNTDAETLALYQRGAWGTMPEQRAADAERLTGAYLP